MKVRTNIVDRIRIGIIVFLVTAFIWIIFDFVITKWVGSRGASQFLESSMIEGRKNRNNFSAIFGSWLDEFSAVVSLGGSGERISLPSGCKSSTKKTLFLGDSTTAGFEVDNDKTFVSVYNKSCEAHGLSGINLGVRGHDTHSVIGTYLRVKDKINHDFVIYMMTGNDFSENINPNAYRNKIKQFGRRFENMVHPPVSDFWFNMYAGLKMFISDNFSTTKQLITEISKSYNFLLTLFNANDLYVGNVETYSRHKLETAVRLISDLDTIVRSSGARLYVVSYPCLYKVKLCSEETDLFKSLDGQLKTYLVNVKFLILEDLVRSRVRQDELKIENMRFRRDGHLSNYGHSVVGSLLIQDLHK